MAKLVLNVGGMFSGKSTELIKQGQRHLYARQRVVFVKPEMDDRYSTDEIVTHDGKRIKAINYCGWLLVPEVLTADVVLIDEIQFFPIHVFKQIKELLADGKNIYISGLDKDFRGNGFLIVEMLMTEADEINKLKSVCEMCGADAGFTGKRENLFKSSTVEIQVKEETVAQFELGEKDVYIPLCRSCHNNHIESQVKDDAQ